LLPVLVFDCFAISLKECNQKYLIQYIYLKTTLGSYFSSKGNSSALYCIPENEIFCAFRLCRSRSRRKFSSLLWSWTSVWHRRICSFFLPRRSRNEKWALFSNGVISIASLDEKKEPLARLLGSGFIYLRLAFVQFVSHACPLEESALNGISNHRERIYI